MPARRGVPKEIQMNHSRLTFTSNRSRSGGDTYQRRVAWLLARIERYSRERRRLESVGAQPAVLAPIDERLDRARADLAALVSTRAEQPRTSLATS